ncbi:MAG: GPP34 family phosphoprotein [Bacteroidales bacterium]|nr:GPP34 family phosphoprotein [Bacteroidales bacterium]
MADKLDLNILDKLVLLALDDEKGTFVSDSMVFGYCLAGAVIFELSIRDRIKIVDGKIRIVKEKRLNDEVLDYCLDIISDSKKDRKINHWIEILGNKEGSIRKIVLDKLISLKILQEREDKVLWIFKTKKFPTKNELPENLIRKRLNDIIKSRAKAELDEIMIISLVDSCGLNNEVYGKALAKEKAKKIKSIIKEYQFADNTGKVIKELHDTILAVLILIISTTTITTTTVN